MPVGVYQHKPNQGFQKGYKMSQEHKLKLSLAKLGKKQSKEMIDKRALSLKGHIAWNKGIKEGEGNAWKGDSVGYGGLHQWVYKNLGKAIKCENGCMAKRYEWANISGEYKRDLDDFKQLCKSCHLKFDQVHLKVWQTRRIYA